MADCILLLHHLRSPALALWSAAAAGVATGILPIGLAEATALAIGLVSPRWLAFAMGFAFTLGHVAAKLPWYGLGLHADRAVGRIGSTYLARARDFLAARPGYGVGVLGVSAVLSVPPFHLAAIAAGLVRVPFLPFVAMCLGGRLLRFGVLVAAPQLLRPLLG
jgi:membrane protein YqaA with SNARE-associated domain